MRDCWKAQPEQRPRFRDLADDLEKELDTLDREKKLDMSANGDDSKLFVFQHFFDLQFLYLLFNEIVRCFV